MSETTDSGHIVFVDDCKINLKNRYFATVLAFLLPGAGHFYQGRKNKACLFALCILGLFGLGLFVGNARVVYAAWNPEDYRIQFPAQLCVGIPAFPAAIQGWIHRNDPKLHRAGLAPVPADEGFSLNRFMAPPRSLAELDKWHFDASAGFELGSLFTAVAGLLNLLAIFDAYAGPMPLPTAEERRKKGKS
jgi:TM2 domain-containing membrane protein YozV